MDRRLGPERARYVADESHILFVWPNLLLFDLEGLSIRQLEPVAADQTDVRAWQLAPRGEDEDTRALDEDHGQLRRTGRPRHPDDIEAYEAVQRGIEATAAEARPGLDYSDMSRGMVDEVKGVQGRSIDEGAMRGFWRHWVHALDVEDGLSVAGPRPERFLEGRNVR